MAESTLTPSMEHFFITQFRQIHYGNVSLILSAQITKGSTICLQILFLLPRWCYYLLSCEVLLVALVPPSLISNCSSVLIECGASPVWVGVARVSAMGWGLSSHKVSQPMRQTRLFLYTATMNYFNLLLESVKWGWKWYISAHSQDFVSLVFLTQIRGSPITVD